MSNILIFQYKSNLGIREDLVKYLSEISYLDNMGIVLITFFTSLITVFSFHEKNEKEKMYSMNKMLIIFFIGFNTMIFARDEYLENLKEKDIIKTEIINIKKNYIQRVH